MKKIFLILFIASIFCDEDGHAFAVKVDSRPKPDDIISINKMILIDSKNREKELKLISKTKDDSKLQMIWFLKPADDRGTAFLKIEKDGEDDFMSMWVPSYNRYRRISSSKKTDAFMGSDLSFEDLTNRSLDKNDYEYTLVRSKIDCEYNGAQYDNKCFILKSKPLYPNSEYSYHKTTILNIKENIYIAIDETSYDKNEVELKKKSIVYEHIRNNENDYYIMKKLIVTNVQENHTTKLEVSEIEINNGFVDEMFVERSLKRLP